MVKNLSESSPMDTSLNVIHVTFKLSYYLLINVQSIRRCSLKSEAILKNMAEIASAIP